MWLRRSELGAVLTALCALLAVSPQAFAASGPVASQHQVMLWWLHSSMAGTPAQVGTAQPDGLETIAPHEAAALLASLQQVTLADPAPVALVRLAGAHSRPAPLLLNNWHDSTSLPAHDAGIASLATSPFQPMLEPHAVAYLNGIRANANLE